MIDRSLRWMVVAKTVLHTKELKVVRNAYLIDAMITKNSSRLEHVRRALTILFKMRLMTRFVQKQYVQTHLMNYNPMAHVSSALVPGTTKYASDQKIRIK